MEFLSQINPVHEAVVYLTRRFAAKRASDLIMEFKQNKALMQNFNWAYCERIAEIERTLDEEFELTDQLRYYFMPLETRDERADENPLSLGSLLLEHPQAMTAEFTLDNVEAFYSTAPRNRIVSGFYSQLETQFLDTHKGCSGDLSDFMTLTDARLVKPEDKWRVIDLVRDPLRHFEALRETVARIAGRIGEMSADFSAVIESEKESFGRVGSGFLYDLANLDAAAMERAVIFPSLMLVNGVSITSTFTAEDEGPVYIYLGIVCLQIVELRGAKDNFAFHMNIVKALSDETRMRALCEMADSYSYGQELAEKLGSSRNAMYYHLDKLACLGLIKLKVTDYRMLYTMNKKTVYEWLTALRDFLVGGWKPEDEEQKE